MNKKMKIVLLAGIVLAVLVLGSCSLIAGMSIETRITQFQTDLNAKNADSIQDNFSSGCAVFKSLNTEAYWTGGNSIFDFGNVTFAISVDSVSGSNAYGSMMYNSGKSGPLKVHFEMVNDGILGGWKILKIWTGESDATQQIKVLVH